MALKDENFAKVGKPEAYTDIIEKLKEEDVVEVAEYDFELEDEEEE